MNKNQRLKVLALLLIVSMMFPSCVAGEITSGSDTDTDSTTQTGENASETTLEDLYPLPDVQYDGKNYDMLVVRTDYWGQDYNDLYLDEDNVGDTVGSAAYQRALRLEEEYGMIFVQTESADAVGQALNLYKAGYDTYELVHGRAVMMMPTLASNGALHDINT
ncbi:MAG: hypothetical protein IJX14_00705, partial [Clostridia bacterium]|nr:hypothetical protein [Clostridia bacterium]